MRYFGGKVGLLEALFDDAWTDLNERVRKATSRADEQPRGAPRRCCRPSPRPWRAIPTWRHCSCSKAAACAAQSRACACSQGLVAFAELARGLVRKGQAAREIDAALDAAAITSALMGACEAMIRDRVLARASGGRAFAEREIRRTLDAMLNGFSSKSARPLKPGGAPLGGLGTGPLAS